MRKNKFEFIIDPEFQSQIPALTDEEFQQLEENILSEREVLSPLIVWGNILVDGHNRYKILQQHPEIPYTTRSISCTCETREDVLAWICKHQLGRRNLTPEQKKFLIGKQYHSEKSTRGGNHGNQYTPVANCQIDNLPSVENTTERIAKENNVSPSFVIRAEQFMKTVELMEKYCPGIQEEILSGKLKLSQREATIIRGTPTEALPTVVSTWREEMRNLHTAERLVRGFLFELRTCLDHMETKIKQEYGKTSEFLKVFEDSTHATYNAHPEYAFTYHLRNVSQHCQNIVHGFNSPTGIGISCNVQKLLNEYDKWKPVDKDYMINSGENVDLLKTFSVAFQAFNEALIPVIRYLLNTKNVGKELLYLRKWGDSLQKQFHHDVHCYHIFDLKFQNGNDATHEDLDTGDVIINGTLIDWDMVYELSDSVIAMPIANTSTNNLPL